MSKKTDNNNDGATTEPPAQSGASEKKPKCGIIRPIAPTEGYSSNHWAEIGEILAESILSAGFEPRIVSDADNVAVIHGTIVQNIFEDPIIVCDVSSRNPNVMFELGMRLAFDKPVVIVKDDVTNYAFDTGVIEHISYPKSLHYHDIGIFKEKLRAKILSTAEKSKETGYSPFLKHFRSVSITPQKLQNEDMPLAEYVVNKLDALELKINRLSKRTPYSLIKPKLRREIRINASDFSPAQVAKIASVFDGDSTVTRKGSEIIIAATMSSEESEKFHGTLNALQRGVPFELLVDSLRNDAATDASSTTANVFYNFASEVHPIPD